ncbi:type IV pilin-like G/H family protein [Microcoleus sp. CAWBG640]|uniref:type IV pilin-like G/H family protein n=1 Tax=Microcoleus sp. CAWBG640 TaxID=2841653 RepID=UPI00312B3AEC
MTKNQESIIDKAVYGGCGCLLFIICIGVAPAFVLPIFLNSTNTSKQREGKEYVAALNKGQQAYFAEKSVFSTSVNALGVGIKTETTNFKYSVSTTKKTAFNYGIPKQPQLRSDVGGVFVVPAKEVEPNAAKNEIKTISILCQADSIGTIKPAEPTYQNGKIACGKGTTKVTK